MIEDSHTNAARLVKSMDQFLKIGDYLVIEDTLSKRKYNETILSGNGINTKIYKVDTHYCDLWGLNNTWNVNTGKQQWSKYTNFHILKKFYFLKQI